MLVIDSLQTTTYNVTLLYAAVWTINSHYASDSTKPLTIVHFASREMSRWLHNDLIDAMLGLASSAARIKFVIESETERLMKKDTEQGTELQAEWQTDRVTTPLSSGQTTAIWLLDSMRAYQRLEQRLLQPDSSFKRNGYYCIIYTGQERGRMETIKEMFRRLFAIYVLNVNVLLTNPHTASVEVFNYYPFRSQRCQSSRPVHYATFPGAFGAQPKFHLEDHKLFFDDKLENMHGCDLVTVTFQHRPYVIIDPDSNEPGGQRIHGIEGMLFRLIAERMNFTIKLLEQIDQDRGVVLPNGTLTGAMKLIVDGMANITFGAFMYNKERAQHMLPTVTYTSFPIVLCIPGGQQLSPLERLTKPLGYIIWLCLLLSLLLGFGLIGIMQLVVAVPGIRSFVLGEGNRWPCLALWNILLGGLHHRPPRRNFARYLLMLWLLQTLVIRAAYTGELYILLQDGRARTPLRSLAEVLEQKYVFHMLPALQIVFRDLVPVMRVVVKSNLKESLRVLRDEEDAHIVVPLLQPTVARYDMDAGPDKPRLTVLPDPLLTAPITLYMRPHSYLKQRVGKLIMNMMSSGLVHRFRRMYLDRIEHMAALRNRDPTKLSLWLLAGIFGCFGLMQLFACFVFLLELRSAAPHRPRLRRLMAAANFYIV